MDFVAYLVVVANGAFPVLLGNKWLVISENFYGVIMTGSSQPGGEKANMSRHCIQIFLKLECFFVGMEKRKFSVFY